MRSLTLSQRMPIAETDEGDGPAPSIERPRTRADCKDGPRPCPWVGCRHHLYLDISGRGSLKLNFPEKDFDEIAETCSIDVADRGEHTLEQIGDLMNVTRERARQLEARGLVSMRSAAALDYVPDSDRAAAEEFVEMMSSEIDFFGEGPSTP